MELESRGMTGSVGNGGYLNSVGKGGGKVFGGGYVIVESVVRALLTTEGVYCGRCHDDGPATGALLSVSGAGWDSSEVMSVVDRTSSP